MCVLLVTGNHMRRMCLIDMYSTMRREEGVEWESRLVKFPIHYRGRKTEEGKDPFLPL